MRLDLRFPKPIRLGPDWGSDKWRKRYITEGKKFPSDLIGGGCEAVDLNVIEKYICTNAQKKTIHTNTKWPNWGRVWAGWFKRERQSRDDQGEVFLTNVAKMEK